MPKKIIGTVSSDLADKTIVISVTSRETHPIYGKQYSVTRKYTAHDEKNEAHKGDRVEISECRPISKTKSWKLDRVIETGHADVEVKDEDAVAAVTQSKADKEDEE
ncbi:MAG: 30S ribosomal protein S17 [Candidatus Saccharimonadales bacterium]